jgi:hypothetical protein
MASPRQLSALRQQPRQITFSDTFATADTQPDILLLMVAQLRFPRWLTPTQQGIFKTSIMPNVFGSVHAQRLVYVPQLLLLDAKPSRHFDRQCFAPDEEHFYCD